MNYSTYRFTLDIHHTKSQVSIPIPHMDTAVQFFINLTDGGKPYQIGEGCTAKLFGKKADGTSLVHDCDIIDNTRIHYKFNEQTSSALGVVDCEIRLYGSTGLKLTTPSFDILVVPRVLKDDEIIESEAEKSAIDNLFISENERVEAEKAREAAEKARESAEEIRKQNEIDRENTVNELFENAEINIKEYTDEAEASAGKATAKALQAENFARKAEAYAIGKMDDVDANGYVYNNAKYFSEVAKGHSDDALTQAKRAKGWANGDDPFSWVPSSTNNAKYYSEQAKKYVDNLGLRVIADNVNYKYTFQLTHEGVAIGNGITIDLPIESLVVGVAYDEDLDALKVNLKGGETVTVPLGEIIQGLARQQYVDEELGKRYTKPEVDKMVGGLKGHYAIVRDKILEIKSDTTWVQSNTLIFAY